MNLRTLFLLSMVVGLSVNWAILDNLSNGVSKIQDALIPDDINLIPAWVKDAFTSFKTNFNKSYSPTEYLHRLGVFFVNLRKIQFMNEDSSRSYRLGETEFMDLERSEFVQMMLMRPTIGKRDDVIAHQREAEQQLASLFLQTSEKGTPAPSIDWRGKAVTPVKNQGKCGSCWTFSVTHTLEGFAATNGEQLKLSQQHLLDCCPSDKYNCEGCGGSWPADAFAWVRDFGIAQEDEYRDYDGKKGQCQLPNGSFRINGFKYVPPKTNELKLAVNKQPISIVIDASDWMLYKEGIFDGCSEPNKNNINHAVTLVGYTDEYWIVKNSWGKKWGEDGYIKLKMGNQCGIIYEASYPL